MSNGHERVLVTGGSGFLGSFCIMALLKEGYKVRTTVRSRKRAEDVKTVLKTSGAPNLQELDFVEADLVKDEGWAQAVSGCEYVLHVASPFPSLAPRDENELIIPARDGALKVLKAARDADVKRVVMTSSFAAIGYSIDPKDHVFTEEDWTDPDKTNEAYIKSKTIAERAAWQFMEEQGGDLELTVINPVGIFGPAMGADYAASLLFIKNIMRGEIKETPNFSFGVVDVRDVADLHLKAMKHPLAKGQRFLATADGAMNFYEIAQLIKKEKTNLYGQVSDLQPLPQESMIRLSNKKARAVFDWNPRSKEEAILASVDSILTLEMAS